MQGKKPFRWVRHHAIVVHPSSRWCDFFSDGIQQSGSSRAVMGAVIFVPLFWFCLFVCFFFFRPTFEVDGGSKVRGRIRATAAGLHHSHSNSESEPHL